MLGQEQLEVKLLCHELSLAWGWPEVPLSPPDAAGAAPAVLAQLAVALSPAWMAPEGPSRLRQSFCGRFLSLSVSAAAAGGSARCAGVLEHPAAH